MEERKLNYKKVFILELIVIIILMIPYIKIINKGIESTKYAEELIEISKKNENQIFNLSKIILYSSANTIDKSEEQNLSNLTIYQYTDIALYINNKNSIQELSNKNTIKQLYIDNIELISSSELGKKSLNYKNLLNFGKKENIKEDIPEKIDFEILYTNEENNNNNYENPAFYTDCSNPITLEYVNNELFTNYKTEDNSSISFDGRILENVGIKLEDIAYRLKFKINIVNNNDEAFSLWFNLKVPLTKINEGTSMLSKDTVGSKYTFFRF